MRARASGLTLSNCLLARSEILLSYLSPMPSLSVAASTPKNHQSLLNNMQFQQRNSPWLMYLSSLPPVAPPVEPLVPVLLPPLEPPVTLLAMSLILSILL